MRKTITICTLVMGLLLLTGCGGNHDRIAAQLCVVDSLMDGHADSALHLLDSLGAEREAWPKRLRMRHALLTMKAQNKAYVDFTTDSLALVVTDYYDHHGTANEQMMAHYLLGCVYRDLGEVPHALDCYQEAVSMADTTATDCDYRTLSNVYSQMARMFHQQLLLTNEIDARYKASHYCLLAKDTLNAIHHRAMSAGAYILLNYKDSAEALLHETIRSYQDYGQVQRSILTSTMLMHLYAEQPEKKDDFKELIDKYEIGSDLFDKNHELPPTKRLYYYYKGRYLEETGMLDSAEYYYRKVYRPNMDFTDKTPMYNGLLSVFKKRHIPDSIAKYAQLYCEANDSSVAIKDQERTAQLAVSYNYHYYKDLSLKNERDAYKNWLISVCLIISLVLVILACFYVGKKYKKAQEKKRMEMQERFDEEVAKLKSDLAEAVSEYEQKIKTLQQLEDTHSIAISEAQHALATLREEKENSMSEKKKAQETIECLNAKFHQEKAGLLEEISILKDHIEELKHLQTVYQQSEETLSLVGTEIIKKLHILSKSHRPMNNSDRVLLQKTFVKAYPLLVKDLMQQGKIKQSDITVCLLTVMGFPPAAICNLTNLSSSSVTNIRSKVNNSLFQDKSAATLHRNLYKRYGIKPIEIE